MTEKDLIELRAALIQLAKAQETQVACTKRIIAVINRNLPPSQKKGQLVTVSERDSIAGIIQN